jgi:hypothetical protein
MGQCQHGNYNALLFLVDPQLLGAADGALRFQGGFAGDGDDGRVAQHQTLVVGVAEILVNFRGNSTTSLRDFYLLDYVLDGGFAQIRADVAHLVHGAEGVDRSAFAVDDFRVERFETLFAGDVGDFLVVVRIAAVQSAVQHKLAHETVPHL